MFARHRPLPAPGDLLVLNNTRVFPARLLGRRDPSGGEVECLLIQKLPTSNAQLPKRRAEDELHWELGVGSWEF